jgi:hypothetical protein
MSNCLDRTYHINGVKVDLEATRFGVDIFVQNDQRKTYVTTLHDDKQESTPQEWVNRGLQEAKRILKNK